MRVGILTEFPSVCVQSGPAIHTRFLHDGLRARGHDVTVMGPEVGGAPEPGVKKHLFKGISYPTHPKVQVPFPWPMDRLRKAPELDIIHGQANSHMVHYSAWMRRMFGTAVLNTHIIHLPTHSHFLLSNGLYENPVVWQMMQQFARTTEENFAAVYNQGDGLVVQSRYMVDYWRERGVTVPIEAIGRPINPATFDQQPQSDPFPTHFKNGKRLLVVCRHDREKRLDHLIRIFDEQVAPADAEATLTIVGDGFDHLNLREQAEKSRYGDRVYFPGEVKHARLVDWYAHADVFVYTSLSETFGNVANEALWCGLPAVALHDHMGVAHQIYPGLNGYLVEPNRADTDAEFARRVMSLIQNQSHRRKLAENAASYARRTSHPNVTLSRYEKFYESSLQRVKDEIRTPLCEQGSYAQTKAFAHHMGSWAAWTALLLGVSSLATKVGIRREGTDSHTPAPAPQAPTTSTAALDNSYLDAAE